MKLYDNDAYRDDFMELVYSLLHSDGTNRRANQIIDAFDSAPAVDAEPIPPNDPLTLERLLEMDGEPVWDKSLRAWGLVVGDSILYRNGEKLPICGNMYRRRKPEDNA